MNRPPKITIREVAARVGVSTMTVSRVLRNEGRVSPETREAVQKAMKDLQYEPLQSARNLASSVAKVLGLITLGDAAKSIATRGGYDYVAGLHFGALQVCLERDYGLWLFNVNDLVSADINGLVRRVRSRQIGGYVVAAPATEIDGLFEAFREAGIVHAAVSPMDTARPQRWAAANEREATRALTEHLIAHGHRDIAYVGGTEGSRAACERSAGFMDAMAAHCLKAPRSWVVDSDHSFEGGLAAGQRLLRGARLPSAVCCVTDDVAAGVMGAARARDLRLPEDLSLVGFNNFGLAQKLWPGLTTANLPIEDLAAHATRQVIDAIQGGETRCAIEPCPLVLRASVAMIKR